jgi:SAM-dependent methyltransferase
MSVIDRLIRKVIPSAARLSYNPLFRIFGNPISIIPAILYPEFRGLPPNHLRVRVGVNNQLFFNQAYHLQVGTGFWWIYLSNGFATSTSDIVEIGCGCGRIAHHLRGGWFEGSYVGIDIDQELLSWSASHFPSTKFTFMLSPHNSATYSGTDAADGAYFSFPKEWKKDFIYSTSLYTHLLEPELLNYTRESFKVLREGGVMCMSFFCLDSIERGNRWTFQHRIGEAYVENIKYPEAAVAYARQFIEDLCRSVGFREVSVQMLPVQSFLICRK